MNGSQRSPRRMAAAFQTSWKIASHPWLTLKLDALQYRVAFHRIEKTRNQHIHDRTSTWRLVAADDYGPAFLQLQYTQTVLLNFNGLSWPHVSVATLRKR